MASESNTLYRPTGPEELARAKASGFTRWPARLPEQPSVYPATNARYAIAIARDRNAPTSGAGHATWLEVRRAFMHQCEVHQVGTGHLAQIAGKIDVNHEFHQLGEQP